MASLINETQILEVLRRQNDWWRVEKVSEDLAPRHFKRLAFYEVQRWLRQPDLKRAIILSGARRVGKTVVLHQLAQDAITNGTPPRKILYITFEDLTLTQTNLRQILALYEKNIEMIDQQTLILLDEIHYAADWGRWLMTIIREFPRARIVATGSAAVLLRGTQHGESGAGRWLTIHVPTLSFFEYIHLRGAQPPTLPSDINLETLHELSAKERQVIIANSEPLQREFHRYLLQGGFPASVGDKFTLATAQRLIREDVIDKALKRDMAYLYGVRSLSTLDQLFVYLCFNVGAIVEKNTIAKEMGVTATTIERYLQHLEDAHLIYRLEPFHLSGKKSLKPRPKIYLADATLRNAVLLRGDGLFSSDTEISAVIEATVFKHLYAFYYPDRPRFGYWRDPRSSREVDFLLLFPDGRRLAYEVKYRESPKLTPKEGLIELLGSKPAPERAWLITKHSSDFGPLEQGRVLQIPAVLFTYLLGHIEQQRQLKGRPVLSHEIPYGQKSEPISEAAMNQMPPTPPQPQ